MKSTFMILTALVAHISCFDTKLKDTSMIMTLSMDMLQEAKILPWSHIMKILDGTQLPDYHLQEVNLTGNRFYIIEDSKDVRMTASTDRQSLVPRIHLEADDLVAGFTSTNFSEGLQIFSAKSRVEAKIKKVKVSVDIDVTSQSAGSYTGSRTLAFKL